MGDSGPLLELIRKARYRHVWQQLIAHLTFASAVALGCAIPLLLLGTRLLGTWWLIVVVAVSLGAALFRGRKRIMNRYQLAQALDRGLQLKDSLSTAVYFVEHPDQKRTTVIRHQRDAAEQQARSVDHRVGLPFRAPKALYASSCLAAVAISIFAVRYGVTRSMDLSASLVHIPFGSSAETDQLAALKKKAGQKNASDPSKDGTLSYDPWDSKVMDQQGAPDAALNTVDEPEVNNPDNGQTAEAKAKGQPSQDPAQEQGDPSDQGDRSSGNDAQSDNVSAPDKDGERAGKQGGQDKQGNNSSGDNSSLSDKMRDALANLMSKLKGQKQSEGKQGSSPSQNASQGQQRQRDDKGSKAPGKPQSDGQSSQDAQGDQEGESSDKAQSAQNKSAQSSDKPTAEDGKSGIGKQDGDKSTRLAEQQAAMGKISEIIGKRVANMTGEVMVEVGSGKQGLRTEYSQRRADHAEAGGEINRDEVPLAYQKYVQQYFEEIRKAPPASQKPNK